MNAKTFKPVQQTAMLLSLIILAGCQPSPSGTVDATFLPWLLLCGIIVIVVVVGIAVGRSISLLRKSNTSPTLPMTQDPASLNTKKDLPPAAFILVSDSIDGDGNIVISTEDIPLDNRHGSSPISSEHEFSQTAKISVSLVKNQEVSAGINATVWSVFEADLNARIAKNLGVEIGQEIHRRVTVKFEALPGKFVRYRVVWKQNVRRGNFEVAIGSKNVKIPYEAIYGLFHSIESISD